MVFARSSGVLMNISSLWGAYGIGGFGSEVLSFGQYLRKMGFTWWQILPLCPIGAGNSPYSGRSAFAINPLYVSPELLVEDGLISTEELQSAQYPGGPYATDYNFARESKPRLLRSAYRRFCRQTGSERILSEFEEQERFWLTDYADFMAHREANGQCPWWEWNPSTPPADRNYYIFEQYILSTQWESCKRQLNELGIRIMGDMPIYVSRDSAEFWAHPELFDTEEGAPTHVAGVPPDYFSTDGQLWGNPLYNWERMERDGYVWWVQRIRRSLELYDAVRIDHFRGFQRYWSVPADATTAKTGEWRDGPGMKLFDRVRQELGDAPIIAEDLGTWDEGLSRFLEQSGYPGMRVIQFGFGGGESLHMPHCYPKNCVAYTGTHDNNTMLGWLWETPPAEKQHLLDYCRFTGDDPLEGGAHSRALHDIITTLWQSSAAITVLPIQDILGYGGDTRINIPGVAKNNWTFRITQDSLTPTDTEFFRRLNQLYVR